RFQLNLALGYGGRRELLEATRDIMREVEAGELDPSEIDSETVSQNVYRDETLDVDLVIRTGGDERISNFLPWQAKGNESTVYFCAPYWPAFRKIDFLRAIRTYENRMENREERDLNRAVSLLRRLGEREIEGLSELKKRIRKEYGPKVTEEEIAEPTSGKL
ncbi:MAG: undecaprenyl diphosphate synthase family protein, partial [Halobacteria archaeon]